MPNEEIQTLRQLAAAYPKVRETPLKELREMTDQLTALFPVPEGLSVEDVDAGGVPAEWVKAVGAQDHTAIVYLHGGGYTVGSPASHRHLAAAISGAAGARVLSLGYRLSPEHPFPAAVEDAVKGYGWLLDQGIEPGRSAIAGDSAGGGLTVATLLALRDEGGRLPAAGICISPWVDLTCSSGSYTSRAEVDPLLNQEDTLWFASMYLGKQDPAVPLASPLFANLAGLPPLLIHVGSDEVLLDDSVRLDKRAREAGVESTLEVWEDMIHAWHVFYPMLEEGRQAISRIGEYFKSQISSTDR